MSYNPFTYGEKPLSSSKLNANFAGKADIDSVTGKVVVTQLPDIAAIVHQTLDTSIAAVVTTATSAATAATAATTAATAATTAATAATTAATAASTAAAAAIPLTQKAVINGVASLGADGKVPLAQLPSLSGGPALTAPLAADFPLWVNQGVTTSANTVNGLLVVPELTGSSAGNVLKGAFRNLPTGDFDIEIIVNKCGLDWPYFACGVALRETSSGRFLTIMQGKVYFADPATSAISGDWGGVAFQEWSNSNTVSMGQGIPCDTDEVHYRITRVGTAVTFTLRRGFNRPWIHIWGITPDALVFDQVGFCCNSNSYGAFTSFPEQPFLVRHYGVVLP